MPKHRKAWLVNHGTGIRHDRDRRLPGYYARYYEYTPEGRRNRSKHFNTLADARKWVKQYNARLELGILGEAIPIERRDAVEEFAAGLTTLADETVRQYMTSLGMFAAVVGDKLVRDIGGTDIDRFIADRMGKSSESTVAKHVRALKAFFNWAVKRGYTMVNPVKLATRLPSNTAVRERPAVSEKQLAKLIDSVRTEDQRIAIWLALTTGLDRGVIERLCTAQIDQECDCIRIQRPKTRRRKKTITVVPIHPQIASLLYARLNHDEPSKPLLSGIVHQGDDRDWWLNAREKAGLPGLLFRDLRAVASSRPQRLARLTLTDVQNLLGHASPLTTAGHYHLPDPTVVQRLNELPLPGAPDTAEQSTAKS